MQKAIVVAVLIGLGLTNTVAAAELKKPPRLTPAKASAFLSTQRFVVNSEVQSLEEQIFEIEHGEAGSHPPPLLPLQAILALQKQGRTVQLGTMHCSGFRSRPVRGRYNSFNCSFTGNPMPTGEILTTDLPPWMVTAWSPGGANNRPHPLRMNVIFGQGKCPYPAHGPVYNETSNGLPCVIQAKYGYTITWG